MAEHSFSNPADEIPQQMNCADYCDALNAERWLRLRDARLRAKRVRALLLAAGQGDPSDLKIGRDPDPES
jgi:hypothetical protein